MATSSSPEGLPREELVVLRKGFLGLGRVEQVTISGTQEATPVEPLRDPDGRIDVDATLATHRPFWLPDASSIPDGERPSWAGRAVFGMYRPLHRLLHRRAYAESEAAFTAAGLQMEDMARQMLIRLRDEEG